MAASDALQGLQFDAIRGAYSTTHYAYLPGAEECVGHVSVNHLPDEPAELASIRVGDDYQGRRLGSALLEHAIAQHPGPMTLHADPFGNKAMTTTQLRSFYGRHGFRPRKNGEMTWAVLPDRAQPVLGAKRCSVLSRGHGSSVRPAKRLLRSFR